MVRVVQKKKLEKDENSNSIAGGGALRDTLAKNSTPT